MRIATWTQPRTLRLTTWQCTSGSSSGGTPVVLCSRCRGPAIDANARSIIRIYAGLDDHGGLNNAGGCWRRPTRYEDRLELNDRGHFRDGMDRLCHQNLVMAP